MPEGTTSQKRGSESPELSKPSASLADEVRPPGTCLHCLFRSPKHIVFVSPVCLSPSQPAKGSVADPGGSPPRSEHPVSPQHVLKPRPHRRTTGWGVSHPVLSNILGNPFSW